MSLVSGVLLTMLEKELAAQAPEVEAYVLQLLGVLGKDLIAYVEKKIHPDASAPATIEEQTNG